MRESYAGRFLTIKGFLAYNGIIWTVYLELLKKQIDKENCFSNLRILLIL